MNPLARSQPLDLDLPEPARLLLVDGTTLDRDLQVFGRLNLAFDVIREARSGRIDLHQ